MLYANPICGLFKVKQGNVRSQLWTADRAAPCLPASPSPSRPSFLSSPSRFLLCSSSPFSLCCFFFFSSSLLSSLTFSLHPMPFRDHVVRAKSLGCVQLLVTSWTSAGQAPLSSTTFWSLLGFTSAESMLLSNHPILCRPFSFCLRSFPAWGSFPVSWLFTSGGQGEKKGYFFLQHIHWSNT